jgi:tRNA threonylcarbamoyladenosine biosynthesis protein TsaB
MLKNSTLNIKLMKGLILDTSTETGIIALAENDQLLIAHTLPSGPQLSKNFLPSIRTLIHENNFELKNLSYVAVGAGPGSYTGTRVAVAIGKSLGFALDIPVISFSSILAFLGFDEGPFAYIADAKMQECFVLKGHKDSKKITKFHIEGLFPYLSLSSLLKETEVLIGENSLPLHNYVYNMTSYQWLQPSLNLPLLNCIYLRKIYFQRHGE